MGVAVNTSGALVPDGTEQALATVTAANVYVLALDLSGMANGTTQDIIEVREYGKARSGDTERLLKVYSLQGAQTEALFETIPRVSPHHVRYTVKRVQGSVASIPWAIYQCQ